MTQISRPFQIALLAMCLFAAVWFFALQGHSTSTNGSITILIKSSNYHGRALKTMSLTFPVSAKTRRPPSPVSGRTSSSSSSCCSVG